MRDTIASFSLPRVSMSRRLLFTLSAVAAVLAGSFVAKAEELRTVTLDWATYNPLSIVLKDRKILETAFEKKGVSVRWVQSRGSNQALQYLAAGSADLASTAGAAALVGRVNGNPIKAIYVYSAPEWTALVTRKGSGITRVADLKGKRVAVTRGTDPHIFLVRALADAGLTEKDVQIVLLQHPDGRTALDRGDVDAWAGLDPMMASAEIDNGDVLFFRNRAANTYGVLDVRADFAAAHPDAVHIVLDGYEQARAWAHAHPADFKALLEKATGLSGAVIDRQIDQRTDLSSGAIGAAQRASIVAAGDALQKVGIIPADANVAKEADALIDPEFQSAAGK